MKKSTSLVGMLATAIIGIGIISSTSSDHLNSVPPSESSQNVSPAQVAPAPVKIAKKRKARPHVSKSDTLSVQPSASNLNTDAKVDSILQPTRDGMATFDSALANIQSDTSYHPDSAAQYNNGGSSSTDGSTSPPSKGHYVGGVGSSHKGGHYVNPSTGDHYTHHKP